MSLSLAVGIVSLVLLGAILLFLWRLVRSPLPPEMQEALEKRTEEKLTLFREEVSRRFSEEAQRIWRQVKGEVETADRSVAQRLEEANRTFAEVKEQLGRLKTATEQVEAVGRNVATLQELLRAPKIRGGLGEFFLADLLSQIMPPDFYSLQYEFLDGQRVDAAIRLKDRLVPVDAKFPLEQFRRLTQAVTDEERERCRRLLVKDVRLHIDSIAEKYIRPSEGTFDFALMYIPAENVYYETVIRDDGVSDEKGIFQHAIARQVIPVTTNSFYAYLQVILQGLRGLAVEERAKEILNHLVRLQQELNAVREDFDRAGDQLRNAAKNFEKAERHLGRFEDKLQAIEAPREVPALTENPPRAQVWEEKEVKES